MNKDLFERLIQNSSLTDGNIAYVEQLYDEYLKNADSVSGEWRHYFDNLSTNGHAGQPDVALSDIRDEFVKLGKKNGVGFSAKAIPQDYMAQIAKQQKELQVQKLINAYRSLGHHHAKLDPLNLTERRALETLSLGHYGLSQADLDTPLSANTFVGPSLNTLRSIEDALQKTYCESIGVEYMHITDAEQIEWIQQRLESVHGHPRFSSATKKRIFKRINEAESLEKFLGARYVGQTRFSLEGGVTLIPMMDELVQRAGEQGVKELIIGMGHRGRLNLLVNILGKPLAVLFQEFEGKTVKPGYSGDVKYHSGYSCNLKTPGGVIHVALAFNPSHLEIIDPVVEGSVRARQQRRADYDRREVVPVLLHGDAAFSGQGVVMETFAFSQARGFATGGTVHIVVNNQIGFTTSNPLDARSSLYCTDIGKMVQAPIFHVNGDDPEAAVFVIQMALDFRMRFKKDVIIDLVCYRRLGHNEADEPSATQPIMYRNIKSHPRTRQIYLDRLIDEEVMTQEDAEQAMKDYRDLLDNNGTIVEIIPNEQSGHIFADWHRYQSHDWREEVDTSITKEQLKVYGDRLTTLPQGFELQKQVANEYNNRRAMIAGKIPFNWGMAEAVAFASIVDAGYGLRLSGQDSRRGTFAHRHATLHEINTGEEYTPLKYISEKQAQFKVIDSILSEEAVLGFEYGYATTDPETLVIWEAQYGDFYNGAQVVVDQFIASGEQKWARLCGLSLFLPHGYEGAGPEHSSARLERFLQACAQQNIQVCVPSTPAQHFHMIRRQILRPYRKPLIVMTPKSLLRNKLSTSPIDAFTDGAFRLLIPEIDDISINKTKRVIFCCGKVYYDLLKKRREKQQTDVAIVRIEQLYPFPTEELTAELKKYHKCKDIVWCQEEPRNQGAWHAILHDVKECLAKEQQLHYIGRPPQASPATGYTSQHIAQQTELVEHALTLETN